MNPPKKNNDFLEDPRIIENYALLQDIGVFRYLDRLHKEIRDYQSLLAGAVDIFNRTSVHDIMDAAVWQISDQFLPSFIVFLWRPLQAKEDLTIRGYRNYKVADFPISIHSITAFDDFFHHYPRPVNYRFMAEYIGNKPALRSLDKIEPELVAPILGPSDLYGIILVGRKMLNADYSSEELDYLQHLMSFVSNAIQNHLHYERSVRDVKTGLFNHGFLMTRLNEEIARSRRLNGFASVIVIDVDNFKDFNDNYGHLAGDRVLENIALLIKQSVRTEDIPSRFGGEEFTILLPDADKFTAWRVAERLRLSISEMSVPWSHPLPRVTISCGICEFHKESQLTAEEIINRADEALYQSKKQGRNRSSHWKSGLLFKLEHKNTERKPDERC
ncbi:MAG: sensor domain-containing diguanylate cyclase [Spirochaetaceae bacterium]|jgi:diguanylate cyclase (GGDEF)-like protein|nr:sensor domain-containing diguanylate cyclase [Spirochaetaceae bacterium]